MTGHSVACADGDALDVQPREPEILMRHLHLRSPSFSLRATFIVFRSFITFPILNSYRTV